MMDIYKFDTKTGFESIEPSRFNEPIEDSDYYLGYLTMEELTNGQMDLQIPGRVKEVLESEIGDLKNQLIIAENYSFSKLSIINEDFLSGQEDEMGIYLEKNRFLIIPIKDSDQSIFNNFCYVITENFNIDSPGKFLHTLLLRLISNHGALYRHYRDLVEDMDHKILSNEFTEEIVRKISTTNHELLRVHTNYEIIVDFCESLIDNVNEVTLESDVKHLSFMAHRVQRYADNFETLREYLVQVRQSYTSQMDYRINNTMQYFTLISSIFLPLTLLTSWYGMNFSNMPEIDHPLGYKVVIALAIFIVLGTVYVFKRKKWL